MMLVDACRVDKSAIQSSPMKALLLSIVLLLPLVSQASEIVTLCRSKRSVTVQPSDIVTVVSVVRSSEVNRCDFTLATDVAGGPPPPSLYVGGGEGLVDTPNLTLTGLTAVSIRDGTGYPNTGLMITLRITKTADQIASQPVVLPAVTDGIYSVTIETSVDMENWAPSAPGDYLGDTSHRFFRVKAERRPASNP